MQGWSGRQVQEMRGSVAWIKGAGRSEEQRALPGRTRGGVDGGGGRRVSVESWRGGGGRTVRAALWGVKCWGEVYNVA